VVDAQPSEILGDNQKLWEELTTRLDLGGGEAVQI
jgi:hypothetical protein